MHSSDLRESVTRLAIAVSLMATACSPPPSATPSSGQSSADCAASPQYTPAAAELRQAVEKGPFFAIASRAGVASCRVGGEDGAITLDYTFRDGAGLQVTRNPKTEYTDQDVRLSSPLGENPVDVLRRAEQAAFDSGCGIDWGRVETSKPGDEPEATESVYRGDVCNCQARARSDASGRVLRLQLRSAC